MKRENKVLLCILGCLLFWGCASPKDIPGKGGQCFSGGYSDAFLARTHNGNGTEYNIGYISGYITVLPVNLVGMVVMPVIGFTGAVLTVPGIKIAPRICLYFMVDSFLWGIEWGCHCVNGYRSLHWVDNFRANRGDSKKRNAASRFVDGFVEGYSSRVEGGNYYESPHGTITHNAYGLGVHSDQYGRPVRYEVQGWPKNEPTGHLRVKPNVYGPGIGMDQFGRPVRVVPKY